MARLDILRPYVNKTVAEYLGIAPEKLIVDGDGDIPVTAGSSTYYVHLIDADPAILQVYSTVLSEVDQSPELFEKLNEINRFVYYCRLFWTDDKRVIAALEIVAETADPKEIATACGQIAWAADKYDTELHAQFGGKMARDDAPPAGQEAPADV